MMQTPGSGNRLSFSGRVALCLLTFGVLLQAGGCATLEGGARRGATPLIQIQDVTITDSETGTEIRVQGDQPLIYTAYRLSDPLRLVVDLSGSTVRKIKKEIPVENDRVTTVRSVEGAAPNHVSRLEIGLVEPMEYYLETEDATLVIKISKPDSRVAVQEEAEPIPDEGFEAVPEEQAAQEAAVPEAVEEMAPKLPVAPPAKNLTGVKVSPAGEEIVVLVSGDGALSPEIFMLKDFRLVADFDGLTHQVRPNVIPVNHPLLNRIRLGQHRTPKKARLVMDLTAPVSYKVNQRDSEVEIRVTPLVKAVVPRLPPVARAPVPPVVPAPTIPQPRPATPVAPTQPVPAQRAEVSRVESVPKKFIGKRISLDFQDADLSNVLRLIADVSGFNMVLGDDVKGKVTLKLHDVPWDQALDIILRSKGLGKIQEGNIIRIDTNSNIAKQQDEEAKAKESLIKAEDLVTQIIRINFSKASDLSGTLKKSLSPRGDITVDDSTNTLIIKDIPKNLADVSELVALLDRETPQILIEARIVQADTSFARDLGIQWGGDFSAVSNNSFIGVQGTTPDSLFGTTDPAFAVNLPASGTAGPLGQVGLVFGRFTGNPINLDLRLSAGETRGDTKLLSNPKISTLDNQQASIQQGESIPFETVSQNGTQTQFIDAVINLTVTPHATPNGSVVMDVQVSKNALGTFRSASGTPSIDKKEVSTQILVEDGETIVLGGIFESTKTFNVAGVPWFQRIPILGWFFKRESKVDTHRELLIFITPTIIKTQPVS